MWRAAEKNGQFGAFVRLALLTGQRRAKLATMRWSDIDEDGVWTIPTEAREKGNPGSLALPPARADIIRAQPRSRATLRFPRPETRPADHGFLGIASAISATTCRKCRLGRCTIFAARRVADEPCWRAAGCCRAAARAYSTGHRGNL